MGLMMRVLGIFLMLIILLVPQTGFAKNIPEYNFLKLPDGDISKPLVWREYNKLFDTYLGVKAYCNKSKGQGGKHQCTTLAHRFIREVYGIPTKIGMGLGHGQDLAYRVGRYFKDTTGKTKLTDNKEVGLVYFENNQSKYPPVNGSIISFKWKKYGHVAVVKKVEYVSDSKIIVYMFEQHGTKSWQINEIVKRSRFKLVRDKNGLWHGDHVVGWLSPVLR